MYVTLQGEMQVTPTQTALHPPYVRLYFAYNTYNPVLIETVTGANAGRTRNEATQRAGCLYLHIAGLVFSGHVLNTLWVWECLFNAHI